MLKAALTDMNGVAGAEVATLMGHGLAPPVPEVQSDPVGPDQFLQRFRDRLGWAEAVLVIAPETGGILASLTREVEAAGRFVLGSSAAGVDLAGDKLLSAQRLQAHQVPTPRTAALPPGLERLPDGWHFPVVVKPRDGCGSEAVRLVRRTSQLRQVLGRGGQFLVQPFLTGPSVSVSLLVAGNQVHPLSLNSQMIVRRDGYFSYRGGRTAIRHRLQLHAYEVAAAAALAIPGLQGYIGVDLILQEREPQVLDINPRLTTAYTGLQRGCSMNLMQALLDCCIRGRLPESPIHVSSVAFGRAGVLEGVTSW